ncbi:NAD(P)/FAD-dependent oxidoreductase [Flavitalea flava]
MTDKAIGLFLNLSQYYFMQTDVLIIGQGICGTFLSWWLEQAGVSFLVIDESRPNTASRAAAGLINPVTGRRMVKTWMIDELLPFAQEAYRRIGETLGKNFLAPQTVVDFFPTPQMRLAFLKRYEEDAQYLQLPANEHAWDEYFRYDFGYGSINPCWLADLPGLLAACRKRMLERGILLEERFDLEALIVDGVGTEAGKGKGVRYKEISAGKLIFCDGAESFSNPFFTMLPFAPNKGEALILDIKELVSRSPFASSLASSLADRSPGPQSIGQARGIVFKKGLSLAPWRDGLFWAGSSYEWNFEHSGPTEVFRKKTEAVLTEWLKVPFRIIDHIASVRPATLERRPFVGFHPRYPAIGILNGMGTKGCSLAPYFANQLTEHLTNGKPILPEADVQRFAGILKRG